MSIGAVISAVSGMLDMSVYTDRQKISQSSKNALQEWCADKKRRLPPPRYETLSEDGPDHKKTYVRGCYIGDKLMGRGIGKNFKIADSAAAEDALTALMAQSEQTEKNSAKEEAKPVAKPKETKAKETKAKVKEAKEKEVKPTEKADEETAISVVKISDVVKNAGIKNVGATMTLKNYATSNKKPSPTFRDLGERKNGNKTECAVECSFMGEVTLGTGATRLDARENASQLMAEVIGIGKKKAAKKKSPTAANKPATAKSEASARSGATSTPKAQAEAKKSPKEQSNAPAKKKKPQAHKPKKPYQNGKKKANKKSEN